MAKVVVRVAQNKINLQNCPTTFVPCRPVHQQVLKRISGRCLIVDNVLFSVRVLGDGDEIQGGFFKWPPPKKLKYVKPRLGESTLT